jgi:hypothetical protein
VYNSLCDGDAHDRARPALLNWSNVRQRERSVDGNAQGPHQHIILYTVVLPYSAVGLDSIRDDAASQVCPMPVSRWFRWLRPRPAAPEEVPPDPLPGPDRVDQVRAMMDAFAVAQREECDRGAPPPLDQPEPTIDPRADRGV